MESDPVNVKKLEAALLVNRSELFRFGSALLFVVLIMLFTMANSPGGQHGTLLVAAAMIGVTPGRIAPLVLPVASMLAVIAAGPAQFRPPSSDQAA